jgi:flavorubredoxin
MENPFQVTSNLEILPAHFPVPGAGFLPVNAFVIKAKEPVLVDTGMGLDGKEFMNALESVINPRDLKWVWLTHDDADHTGNLQMVLETAPDARLVGNSLAMMRISSAWPVPMDRVYWLNPGDMIWVGDRNLTAVRPPLFDNPTTIGLYDEKSEVFFSADCFGSIISSPVQSADDLAEEELAQGLAGWASLDNPWVHMVKSDKFKLALDRIRQIAPKMILSAHLPPSAGKTEQFLKLLETVPDSTPAIAPDQKALEQILAQRREGD